MNLVRAEIGRLAARRFVQVMAVILLAAFGITVATTMASSHHPSAAELSTAGAQADLERANLVALRRECEAARAQGSPAAGRYPSDCSTIDPNQARLENYLADVFVFTGEITPLVYFLAAFLALFGLLVGASFVGAELTSGGMTNLLLWRPRRLTVLGTKLGVVLAGVGALALVSTVLYVGTFWALAEATGLPGDQHAGFWGSLVLRCLRGILFALGATALGFGIATLGRHTAAALGVVAGYLVVWEIGARVVLEVLGPGSPEQWMGSVYVVAWFSGEYTFWTTYACGPGYCGASERVTWLHAAFLGGAALALCLGAAFTSFRRRDLA
jgi:ABC-2 type transport system permease protein